MEQIEELCDQLQQAVMKLKIVNLNENKFLNNNRDEDDEDIETEITSGDQIQFESYKAIPEFSGKKGQYRPWRNQVVRRMKMIDAFKKHPKYEAALGIIRSKITGPANVLTNNKTAYNINAIIKTLDSSYADQRPLYVVEAEMTSMKQNNKTLQEFHDDINEALHLVISKIVLAYNTEQEQRSLVAEAQIKAVRTFVVGLRSQMMRNILYSRAPGTLGEAFAIAQTVYYDHQQIQIDQKQESQRYQPRTQQKQFYTPKLNPNINYDKSMQNSTQPGIGNKPEPMKMNGSKQENWSQLRFITSLSTTTAENQSTSGR